MKKYVYTGLTITFFIGIACLFDSSFVAKLSISGSVYNIIVTALLFLAPVAFASLWGISKFAICLYYRTDDGASFATMFLFILSFSGFSHLYRLNPYFSILPLVITLIFGTSFLLSILKSIVNFIGVFKSSKPAEKSSPIVVENKEKVVSVAQRTTSNINVNQSKTLCRMNDVVSFELDGLKNDSAKNQFKQEKKANNKKTKDISHLCRRKSLFQKLIDLRLRKKKEGNYPLSFDSIGKICFQLPTTLGEIRAIKGIGDKTFAIYGEDVFHIINDHIRGRDLKPKNINVIFFYNKGKKVREKRIVVLNRYEGKYLYGTNEKGLRRTYRVDRMESLSIASSQII